MCMRLKQKSNAECFRAMFLKLFCAQESPGDLVIDSDGLR